MKEVIKSKIVNWVMFIVTLAILIIVYLVVFRAHPKVPLLTHTAPFDVFLPKFFKDVHKYLEEAQEVGKKLNAGTRGRARVERRDLASIVHVLPEYRMRYLFPNPAFITHLKSFQPVRVCL
jgi:hypothetical protein